MVNLVSLRCVQELFDDGVDLVRFLVLDPVRDSLKQPQLVVRHELVGGAGSRLGQIGVLCAKYLESSHPNMTDSSLHLL